MQRLTKIITILLLSAILAACAAPTATLEPAGSPLPLPTPERAKLWEDDIYIAMPESEPKYYSQNESYEPPSWNIYNHYGDIVTRLDSSLGYSGIFVFNKSDVVFCKDYYGQDNLFSFDTLDYVIRPRKSAVDKSNRPSENVPYNWPYVYRMRGSDLSITTPDGRTYAYPLDESLAADIKDDNAVVEINDAMAYIYGANKLILYKTGKDISSLLALDKNDWWLSLEDEYAIYRQRPYYSKLTAYNNTISPKAQFILAVNYAVIDSNGEMLLKSENYPSAPEESVYDDRNWDIYDDGIKYCTDNNTLAVKISDEIYEIPTKGRATIDNNGLSDSLVFYTDDTPENSGEHLVFYKTGEDISYLLKDKHSYVNLYPNGVVAVNLKDKVKIYNEGQVYELPLMEGEHCQMNESMIAFFDGGIKRLVLYKTGEDISDLVKDWKGGTIHFYNDYTVAFDSEHYIIFGKQGNVLSTGTGSADYHGHDLFSVSRGNYYGLINLKGEWLIRTLSYTED